jgi:uncharacterized OB-fold protein
MNPITKRHSEIPIESLHTAGVGGQIFFSALKTRGALVGTRCASCAQVYLPARLYCERCFAELPEQVAIEPQGTIKSFTVTYLDRDDELLQAPLALALIQLDGATTLFLHRLLDVSDPSQVVIGDRVNVVLKPEAERTGSILDITGFRLTSRSL